MRRRLAHARAAGGRAWVRAVAWCLAVLTIACGTSDMRDAGHQSSLVSTADGAVTAPREVRLALGWRARDVERQSTAPVQFYDDDRSAEILEDGPVSLAYADPAHAFVLPPGRYLRVDQAAGRVYMAGASPQMDVVGPAEAVALGDSVVRLLEGAGWKRDTRAWVGPAAAVATAIRLIPSDGTGTTTVGVWRIPRSVAPWAAVPPDPLPYRPDEDGVEANLTVKPMKRRSAAEGAPRLLYTLRVTDYRLMGALLGMTSARRARGGPETLAGWDAQPNERILPTTPR